MFSDSESGTSPSLLHQLRCRPDDEEAWKVFVRRYGPKIYQWCRHWGLQANDAEDVTQDVLLKLAAKLRFLQYDAAGSFRGWLKTLAHHLWCDFVTARQRAGAVSGTSEVERLLQAVEAPQDLARTLEEEFDCELMDLAMERVKARVAPHTWEAFRLTSVEGLSGAEVAPRVGMQVAMVFVAKSKVLKMIRQEIQRLDERSKKAELSS